MTTIRVKTTTTLSDRGMLGAFLFVLSPIGSGFAYYFFSRALYEAARRTYGGAEGLIGPSIFLILFGLLFLFGIVLLLIGRDYDHHVEIVPNQPATTDASDGQ
jgi:hypothetical protein